MKKTLLLTYLCAICSLLSAQKINLEQLKGMKMRSIGPAGMSGRVTAIDVDLSNPQNIYIGAASGGVWKSTSGGISWTPIFDKESQQGIGALAINQKNPNEIWVGTGEGNPRNSQNSGDGIYKSRDGGKTWKLMGLKGTKTIHRIIIHRDNPDIVYVAAMGSAWGPNSERGVYKTTDGGKNWSKILYINDQTGCAEMVVDANNPNKIIAAMWEYGRKPWTFNSGGKGSGLYVSFDGGETWERRTEKDGLPKGDLGRMGLAISRSKPNIVYALIEAKENALYRSEDGGFKWKKVGDKNIGDRPFYYAEIYVDPQNENRIYTLFSLVNRSEDGGKTFETILPYSGVHPDHHAFWINPNNPLHLIDGNDGGLNISHDGGLNWRFVENLPLGQFYHLNVDNDFPYNIYGGLQDNGTWIGPSNVWKNGGIRNNDWQEIYFGDGFDAMPRPDNPRYVYAMSQGGNLGYLDRKTGQTQFIKPFHPKGERLRFNWNAALAQNPFADCGIYYGSQYVHKSMDCGQSWEIISPDLTTNDTLKTKQESGGLTPDITNAENHCTILAIMPSPTDKNVIWVGTDDGNLQLTTDGGKNWENLTKNIKDCPKNAWIPYIEVSRKNAGEAFVVVNNYRQNDWKPYTFHTKDYGKTWRRLVDENKVSGFCYSIVQDLIEPNLLFLGTENGLYITFDGGENWNKWMNGYPSVPTVDMKIHPREHDLAIATFGRALYVLDDIRPLREIARTQGSVLNQNLKIFAPSDAYMATVRSVDGVRFNANASFEGETRPSAAMFHIWMKKQEEKKSDKTDKKDTKKPEKEIKEEKTTDDKDKKEEKPKLFIAIFDQKGDTVRNFSTEPDSNLFRVHWGYERNGLRRPSYDDPKPDADPAGSGGQVMPGTYKVVCYFKKDKDSTQVKILADPRIPFNQKDYSARDAMAKEMEKTMKSVSMAANRLKEVEKTTKLMDDQFNNAPDSTKQMVIKLGKEMRDSTTKLLETVLGLHEPRKGINRSDNTLMSDFNLAGFYLRSAMTTPTQNAQFAYEKAKRGAAAFIQKTNLFVEKKWAIYQQKIENLRYSPFKKYEAIKIE